MIEPISFSLEGFNIRISLLCPVPGTGTETGTGKGLCVAKHAIMFLTGALFMASIASRLWEEKLLLQTD